MGFGVQSLGNVLSYTPTITGFSAAPTIDGYYSLNGDICTWIIRGGSGTSNTNAFTITAPFVPHSSMANMIISCFVQDNGSNNMGRISFRSGSNIVDIFPTATTTAWTTSGNKVARFVVQFRIA